MNSFLRSKRVASVTHHLAVTAGGESQGGDAAPPYRNWVPSETVTLSHPNGIPALIRLDS